MVNAALHYVYDALGQENEASIAVSELWAVQAVDYGDPASPIAGLSRGRSMVKVQQAADARAGGPVYLPDLLVRVSPEAASTGRRY